MASTSKKLTSSRERSLLSALFTSCSDLHACVVSSSRRKIFNISFCGAQKTWKDFTTWEGFSYIAGSFEKNLRKHVYCARKIYDTLFDLPEDLQSFGPVTTPPVSGVLFLSFLQIRISVKHFNQPQWLVDFHVIWLMRKFWVLCGMFIAEKPIIQTGGAMLWLILIIVVFAALCFYVGWKMTE